MTVSTADLVTNSSFELDKNDDEPKTWRIGYVKELITVEPLVAAYFFSSIICGPWLKELELQKACLANINANETDCDVSLATRSPDDPLYTQIEGIVTNMHAWQDPFQSIMPLILILFLGSYSDRHQLRKPFMIIPILGEFLAVAGCMLSVTFMRELPIEFHGFVQVILPSFFGGPPMLAMAAFSYISDVSTVEMRTVRVGFVQIVLHAVSPIGTLLSGALYGKIDFYGIFGIALGSYLFAVLYAYYRIKEPRKPKSDSQKSFLADLFNYQHAVDTFNVLLKKNKANNRAMIVLILIIMFLFTTGGTGEGSVIYLYLRRVFHWALNEFTYFSATNTIIHFLGSLIGLRLFNTYLGMEDLSILIIAFLSKIITNILLGVAKTNLLLYIALFVGMFIDMSNIAIRSLASKLVSVDDLGKTQSLLGICAGVLALVVGSPVYNKIYNKTSDIYPSAFFFVGIGINSICLLISVGMYCTMEATQEEEEEKGETNEVTLQNIKMQKFN